jgi:hypothetical protein
VGGASFDAGPVCTVSYREKVKEIKKLLMAQEMSANVADISWALIPTSPLLSVAPTIHPTSRSL